VRDIEQRIQLAEAQSNRELPDVHQPPGIPYFEEHIGLMTTCGWRSGRSDPCIHLHDRTRTQPVRLSAERRA
jgi:hypothetical protein